MQGNISHFGLVLVISTLLWSNKMLLTVLLALNALACHVLYKYLMILLMQINFIHFRIEHYRKHLMLLSP